MSFSDEYGHFLLLGAGVAMLVIASQRKPRKLEDRSGESCDPDESAPFGHECHQVDGDWKLRPGTRHFIGYGPYISRRNLDHALARLGFPGGNVAGFQAYMSSIYKHDVRKDGIIDGETVVAIREAEQMLDRGEWALPRGMVMG